MQWRVLRRTFPWRTGLLMSSIPVLALTVFLAWFRWELPPLERHYFTAYWDSSRHAERPESTTQIEWLYKAAPGRKIEIVIPQDVDSDGAGFLPIGLSSSTSERGWNQLINVPAQTWKSSELESFLREDFYDNRTFGNLIFEPLSFICVIPFLVLYFAVMMRRELTGEWNRFRGELYGVESASNRNVFGGRLGQLQERKKHLFAGIKARLSRHQSESEGQPVTVANQKPSDSGNDISLSGGQPVFPGAFPAKPKQHLIFPGSAAILSGDVPPKSWNESQWID